MSIKEKRAELGMTQLQLAKAVGVTDRAVCKWETKGIAKAQVAVIARVAKVLGTTIEELLD